MIAPMTESKPRNWISSEDAAIIIGVSAQTIRRWLVDPIIRQSKKLRGYRLPSGVWRVNREDAENWIPEWAR